MDNINSDNLFINQKLFEINSNDNDNPALLSFNLIFSGDLSKSNTLKMGFGILDKSTGVNNISNVTMNYLEFCKLFSEFKQYYDENNNSVKTLFKENKIYNHVSDSKKGKKKLLLILNKSYVKFGIYDYLYKNQKDVLISISDFRVLWNIINGVIENYSSYVVTMSNTLSIERNNKFTKAIAEDNNNGLLSIRRSIDELHKYVKGNNNVLKHDLPSFIEQNDLYSNDIIEEPSVSEELLKEDDPYYENIDCSEELLKETTEKVDIISIEKLDEFINEFNSPDAFESIQLEGYDSFINDSKSTIEKMNNMSEVKKDSYQNSYVTKNKSFSPDLIFSTNVFYKDGGKGAELWTTAITNLSEKTNISSFDPISMFLEKCNISKNEIDYIKSLPGYYDSVLYGILGCKTFTKMIYDNEKIPSEDYPVYVLNNGKGISYSDELNLIIDEMIMMMMRTDVVCREISNRNTDLNTDWTNINRIKQFFKTVLGPLMFSDIRLYDKDIFERRVEELEEMSIKLEDAGYYDYFNLMISKVSLGGSSAYSKPRSMNPYIGGYYEYMRDEYIKYYDNSIYNFFNESDHKLNFKNIEVNNVEEIKKNVITFMNECSSGKFDIDFKEVKEKTRTRIPNNSATLESLKNYDYDGKWYDIPVNDEGILLIEIYEEVKNKPEIKKLNKTEGYIKDTYSRKLGIGKYRFLREQK